VFVDYLFDVFRLYVRVPDGVRINDHEWTVAALIKTTGFVYSYLFFQTQIAYLFSELTKNRFSSLSRASLSADTDENVFFEDSHQDRSL